MFVEVDPDEHAQNAQDVHLDAESKRQFDENEIEREGWVDAWCEMCREYALNRPLGSHYMEQLPQYAAKQPPDQ